MVSPPNENVRWWLDYYLVDLHSWWFWGFFLTFMFKGMKTLWSLFPLRLFKVKLWLARALGGRFSNHQFLWNICWYYTMSRKLCLLQCYVHYCRAVHTVILNYYCGVVIWKPRTFFCLALTWKQVLIRNIWSYSFSLHGAVWNIFGFWWGGVQRQI